MSSKHEFVIIIKLIDGVFGQDVAPMFVHGEKTKEEKTWRKTFTRL